MEHLYFLTNLVLNYLLEPELPAQLMNQTIVDDPVPLLFDNKNVLIAHFHKLLLAACICLCIGMSIPLFGFMIACCWCSGGTKQHTKTKPKRSTSRHRVHSNSRSRNRDSDYSHEPYSRHRDSSDRSGSRHHRDRTRRHGHRRSSSSVEQSYRSRSSPPSIRFESACHPCLRTIFSSNMFAILLVISFFAICSFVTNEYINNGIKQLPKTVNQSSNDIAKYLNNTNQQFDNLFRANFHQLEEEINTRLNHGGTIITQKLAISSEASAIANLTDIVHELNDTRVKFGKLDRELSNLKTQITDTKLALEEVETKILRSCPNRSKCPSLYKKYQDIRTVLKIAPVFERLPNIKQITQQLDMILRDGIVKHVSEGREAVEKYSSDIQVAINIAIPNAKASLSNAGKKLASLADEIGYSLRPMQKSLTWSPDGEYSNLPPSLLKYEVYRRYVFLAGSATVTFILLCYIFGWLYGACRNQPTIRTYKTKIKTSASSSFPFSCGIVTMFMIFLPMVLATIVLFMTGSVGDKIICQFLKHPELKQSKQISAIIQNKFLASNISVSNPGKDKVLIEQSGERDITIYVPNYADVLARCHQNQSIVKLLKLDEYDQISDGSQSGKTINFDSKLSLLKSASDFKDQINIDGKFKELATHFQFDWKSVSLLSVRAEDLLRKSMVLSFDDIEVQFTRINDEGNILSIDIEQFIKDLEQKDVVEADLSRSIATAKLLLVGFKSTTLPNITSSFNNIKEGFRNLKLRMFHGHTNYGGIVSDLIAKTRSAERQLQNNGKELLKSAVHDFAEELTLLLQQYSNHAKSQLLNVVGYCEPVSRAFNSLTSAICDDVILPFNGYWLSTMSALYLILIASFFAYALKGLYQLVRRTGSPIMHPSYYQYPEHDDDVSYDDDGEDVALAYLNRPKNSSNSAAPSAPLATDDGWSPTSPNYMQNSRPPPYAV